jgi:hypothetical protein
MTERYFLSILNLHSFGLEQQGKCGKSHGKCVKIARKYENRKHVEKVKKP